MIPGLPNPWLILGTFVVTLGLVIGAFFYGEHIASNKYELSLAREVGHANELLAAEQSRRLAAEQKQAAANNEIEATHAKAEQDIADAHSDFERRLARSLRPHRKCPGDTGAGSQAAHPAGGADDAAVGLFVPEQALRAIGSLARDADEWSAYGRACHAFALSVGR